MKQFILLLTFITLIAVGVLTGCNDNNNNSTAEDHAEVEATEIGDGETMFRLEVVYENAETAAWNVYTNETTVGAALLEVGLIEGEESEFGLYVKSVNGITADYDIDQSYWAFYIDGEYGVTGVDLTDIETDKTYAFVYTKD